MSEDEFDNLSDPFIDVPEEDWSRLLGQTTSNATNLNHQSATSHHRAQNPTLSQPSPSRSIASTDYGDDSLLDADALAELDRIETSVLRTLSGPSPSTHGPGHLISMSSDIRVSNRNNGAIESHYFSGSHPTTGIVMATDIVSGGCIPFHGNQHSDSRPAKRPRSQVSEPERGPVGVDEMARRFFAGYEEELTCAICCDLFIAAHVGNPCGHSYCGDCGWQWIKKNKQNHCPVCRTKLVRSAPLIPNIAMDSLIERHIEQLSSAGDPGWQPQGSKFKERALRKEGWKASTNARMKAKQTRKAEIRPIVIDEFPQDQVREVLFLPSDDDSSYVEDSAGEEGQAVLASARRVRNVRVRRR